MPRTFPSLALLFFAAAPALAQSVALDSGTLAVTTGTIDFGPASLAVGTGAGISENGGRIVTTGTLSASATLSAPSGANVGGLGFVITSGASPGAVTVTRGHTAQSGNGHTSILRYYDVSAAMNAGLGATVVFHYAAELNGLTEANLVLYRSSDGGASWTQVGGVVNTADNTITLGGVDGFSRWTAAPAGLLPVELIAFTVTTDAGRVGLSWTTASETDNAGFHVEQQDGRIEPQRGAPAQWHEVGFVPGRGTTSEQTRYRHVVEGLAGGTYRFRLRQVDLDGHATYSPVAEADIGLGAPVVIEARGRTVRFAVRERQPVRAEIFDVTGRRVGMLFDDAASGGQAYTLAMPSGLASGVYLVRLTGRTFTRAVRLALR